MRLQVQKIVISKAVIPSTQYLKFGTFGPEDYVSGENIEAYGITDGRGKWFRTAYKREAEAETVCDAIEEAGLMSVRVNVSVKREYICIVHA